MYYNLIHIHSLIILILVVNQLSTAKIIINSNIRIVIFINSN